MTDEEHKRFLELSERAFRQRLYYELGKLRAQDPDDRDWSRIEAMFNGYATWLEANPSAKGTT